MSSSKWISAAGTVAGLTVAAILAVLIPLPLWSPPAIAAALLLCVSIAAPAIVPTPRAAAGHGDAVGIWLIGPLGATWGLLLAAAACSLALGLHGLDRLAWAGNVAWFGVLLVTTLSMRAAAPIVQEAAGQSRRAAIDERAGWSNLIEAALNSAKSDDDRRALEKLSEQVRFAANDSSASRPPQNEEISRLVAKLQTQHSGEGEVGQIAKSIESLLKLRELSLKQARSYA